MTDLCKGLKNQMQTNRIRWNIEHITPPHTHIPTPTLPHCTAPCPAPPHTTPLPLSSFPFSSFLFFPFLSSPFLFSSSHTLLSHTMLHYITIPYQQPSNCDNHYLNTPRLWFWFRLLICIWFWIQFWTTIFSILFYLYPHSFHTSHFSPVSFIPDIPIYLTHQSTT